MLVAAATLLLTSMHLLGLCRSQTDLRSERRRMLFAVRAVAVVICNLLVMLAVSGQLHAR